MQRAVRTLVIAPLTLRANNHENLFALNLATKLEWSNPAPPLESTMHESYKHVAAS